jgi:LPXTG-motif cell wall-anchored protein
VIEPIRDNWVVVLGLIILVGALIVWWRSRP